MQLKALCVTGALTVAQAFIVRPPLAQAQSGTCPSSTSTTRMAVALPPLPYDYTALEPYISKRTLEFHHDKHHAKYVTVTNELIKGSELENAHLEEIVKASKGKNQQLFNNAAQVWNHNFYFNLLKKGGGGKPSGKLAELIDASFGGFDNFRKEFATASNTNFGSGWTWLVQDGDKLKIVKTSNADTPITDGLNPIIVIDVWEHAYYLDYQNLRNAYTDSFLDHLVNWEFAEAQLA